MIETRYLYYFLAIAREQNITRAAESLHISQPTLSKQMMDLEEQLGCQLFIRSKKRIELTEDGMFFRSRAQEMLELMNKTEAAFHKETTDISGDIYIGCGETPHLSFVIDVYKKMLKEYPMIKLHIYSGDADSVMEQLDKGLLDIGLLLAPRILDNYNYLSIKRMDKFGLLMRKDSPLSGNATVNIEDLYNLPIILSRQTWNGNHPINWRGLDYKKLNIVSTYNLIYNATFLVEHGLGYAFSLEGLVPITEERNITFRPITPTLTMELFLVTKKYQTFSPAVKLFLAKLEEAINM